MKAKRLLIRSLLLCAATLLSVSAFAQRITVSGTVTDQNGETVIGASVMVPGTNTGAVTDLDGRYTLANVDPRGSLQYSSIGYSTVTVEVQGRTVINVVLEEETEQLDETVIVGYAVGNKRTVTGSVERVKAEDMNTGYVASPLDAISGKIPGMVITAAGGNISSTPTVRIRGTSSLSGGSTPLVIIDGTFSSMSVLERLNADDIAEVTVLKDASETAQYGSRGAAGVIVVTTARGKQGTASVSYNGTVGLSQAYKRIEVMDGDEFRRLSKDKFGGSAMDLGYSTDWQDYVMNKLILQNNHSIALSQGSDKGNVRATIGVNDRNGTVKTQRNTNYNARINLTQYALNKNLRFDVNASGNYGTNSNPSSPWAAALQWNPTFPTHRDEETGMWDIDPSTFGASHPGELMESENATTRAGLNLSSRITYTIIPGLTFNVFGSFSYSTNSRKSFTPNNLSSSTSDRGTASVTTSESKDWMASAQLTYDKVIGDHSINALALVEAQRYSSFSSGATARGFETNYFKWYNLRAGATVKYGDVTSSASSNSLLSYMTRVNYMFKNRYVVTANLRADGASKLGANNKWGFFPSASLAWILTEEPFMKNQNLFSNIKLRVGYGVTGNQDAISALNSLEMLSPNGITSYGSKMVTTYSITRNYNPDLRWEKKYTFDAGVDFSMLKGRIRGTIDYYRSTTKDLLYTYTVPTPPFTFNRLLANMGEMTNNGVEISLTGAIISTKDMNLTVTANAAANRNKLVSLNGTYKGEELTTPEWITLASVSAGGLTGNTAVTYMKEGLPVGLFRMPVFEGFDTNAEGQRTYRCKEIDGNEGIDATVNGDVETLGQVMPKLTSNLSINFSYKHWFVTTQLSGAFGHKIYNFTKMDLHNLLRFPTVNLAADVYDNGIYGLQYHNSYGLEPGDYVNIQYVTVGYDLKPKRGAAISNMRVSLSCNNLATITKYTGLTPLIDSQSLTGGTDARNVYPIMRTFTLQVNLTF